MGLIARSLDLIRKGKISPENGFLVNIVPARLDNNGTL